MGDVGLAHGGGNYFILVTAEEDIPISLGDLRISGATFTRTGKPRNAIARMMLDLLSLAARDGWGPDLDVLRDVYDEHVQKQIEQRKHEYPKPCPCCGLH